MIKIIPGLTKLFLIVAWMTGAISCSHKYNPDILDLSFYQWNQWPDKEAEWHNASTHGQSGDLSNMHSNPPTCGWEVLHRGNGKLVRIPAVLTDYAGVSWYHCRFTLPEVWKERNIILRCEAAGPEVGVYLNEQLLGCFREGNTPFELNVTDQIYYTLDNHLAIRITDPFGGGGISGIVTVKSSQRTDL